MTATDYPGLGTAGTHPYLVGVSEGRAVLDLVRAARHLPGESIGARFAVWGHSQGGQAALFAGELAASYAPELALVGVGAVAPATDLAVLLDDDIASPAGRVLVPFAVWSWSRVYDAPVDSLVKPAAIADVNEVAAGCVETYGEVFHVALDAEPLGRHFLYHDPDSARAVAPAASRRTARASSAPARRSSSRRGRPTRSCARAVTAAFAVRALPPGRDGALRAGARARAHGRRRRAVAPAMVDWIFDRFAGQSGAVRLRRSCSRTRSRPR